MKFTKQDAVESLKRDLTNSGRKTLRMSEKSLDKLTEALISEFADDEIGLPDFCTKALAYLSVFNDEMGKNRADFIKEWEKEHPEQNTNPPTDPEKPKPTEDPALKAYEERIAALEKRIAESDAKSVLAQKRADLTAKLKEKGVKDDKWLDKYLSKVNLAAETDVEAEAEDALTLYNLNKANGGNSVPPANPNGGAPSDKIKLDDVSELAKLNNIV